VRRKRPNAASAFLGALAAFLAASPMWAQLETDSVPFGRTIAPGLEMTQDMERARWRLGPVRILPRIVVENAGYDSNVNGTAEGEPGKVADWTATVGAGARLILPAGPKVFLRADVLPKYTWYLELEDRRKWGGDYGAGVFGFFNRLTFEASGHASRGTDYLTGESPTRVEEESEGGVARLEIEIVRNLSLWGAGELQSRRYAPLDDLPSDVENPADLNRDAVAVRGGLRYGFRRDFQISVGVEATETEFETRPQLSDNESRAWLVGLKFDRERLFANAMGGVREGEPINGSVFPPYSEPFGSAYLGWRVATPLELRAYGRRRVAPSADPERVYYVEERAGLGADLLLARRITLQGYAEFGSNAYPEFTVNGVTSAARRDRIESLAAGVSFLLGRGVWLNVRATHDTVEDGGTGEERTVFRVLTNLIVGEILP
jgi:hypothetical protein